MSGASRLLLVMLEVAAEVAVFVGVEVEVVDPLLLM